MLRMSWIVYRTIDADLSRSQAGKDMFLFMGVQFVVFVCLCVVKGLAITSPPAAPGRGCSFAH